ncbi:GTPase HflX [Natranaerofaba carboxydovora]|uniref:GTPase HflX n=1 Tax=Natranaerofaba carboxydovora TaxID=2742683 RepID=UPI001F134AE3|nr:GTPase HflX [Natranaerofaba carboxydovora]UMZ75006.1 GTPase HflX [Natranaerofaba carboxydovora]
MKLNRAILFGVELPDDYHTDMEESLHELSRLADTAGYETAGTLMQRRKTPHPGYYLGKGKVEELKLACEELEADTIISDDELSPAQVRNLETDLELTVMDRTGLILQIFSNRASTKEAKLQVELARLEYLLPRLRGKGEQLSRLAGGIGTRGSGETKLEIERRHIEQQIQRNKKKLKEVEKVRDEKRKKRKKEKLPLVSLVGYTNSGKSTLLKKLTKTDVIAKNQLFSTLDPKLSSIELPGGVTCIMSDTVGFINKLPHHLVAAFKATLEEVVEADLLLHVVDITSEDMSKEINSVEEVLKSLDANDKPTIMVYNKMDLVTKPDNTLYNRGVDSYLVSALKEEGLTELKEGISDHVQKSWIEDEFFIPYGQENIAAMIHEKGEILKEEYTEEGLTLQAKLPEEEYGRFTKLLESNQIT